MANRVDSEKLPQLEKETFVEGEKTVDGNEMFADMVTSLSEAADWAKGEKPLLTSYLEEGAWKEQVRTEPELRLHSATTMPPVAIDASTQTGFINLANAPIARRKEVRDGVFIHYDAAGQIVRIEVTNLRTQVAVAAQTAERVGAKG